MSARLRRSLDDRGMSLTELLVAMFVFGVLMAIVFSVMITLTYQSRDSLSRAESVGQARLGISHIDRQVRSGNLIADPANEQSTTSGVEPYYSLRIYTQENDRDRCVQWRVIQHPGEDFANLEFRDWDPRYPTVIDYTDWSVVAQNIQITDTSDFDPDNPGDPSLWPPFFVDNAGRGISDAHFVRITLRMLGPGADPDAKPVTVTTQTTGRNTVFGYPTTSCTNIPPVS